MKKSKKIIAYTYLYDYNIVYMHQFPMHKYHATDARQLLAIIRQSKY